MRQTRILQPDYAVRFRCIGPTCEDTCCNGWIVSVDEAAYQRYACLPDSSLQSLFETSIERLPRPAEGKKASFARVRMLPSGDCPFLSEERLCRIQIEHGESYLCRVCAVYPRTVQCIDGLEETELSLSCPEAARLVLLSPSLFPPAGNCHRFHWDETAESGNALRTFFWPIRTFTVDLILNRNYPLWQRLFLLGTFCRRLEAFSQGRIDRKFSEVLDDFSRAVEAGGLSAAMGAISPNVLLQLEIVLTIIVQRVHNASVKPRMRQVLDLFVEGVGNADTASVETHASRYSEAYKLYYDPFFRTHPGILEHYLVNSVLRDAFPFGKKLYEPGAEPEPARAFAMLAIQFALTKGLLIGVAGARRSHFDVADVIQTIHASYQHFEHNPYFLSDAYALLTSRGLGDARGLTMLLRD